MARTDDRGRHRNPPDLSARAPAYTDQVVDYIWTSTPAFERAGADFREIVTVVVGRIVGTIVELWREDRDVRADEVADLVDILLPPTERGITLEDMLAVFRIAAGVLWQALEGLVASGEVRDPALVMDLGRSGATFVWELSTRVTASYLEGGQWWLKRADAEQALVRAVLASPPELEATASAAQVLGVGLFSSRRCAAYAPAGDRGVDGLRHALRSALVTEAETSPTGVVDGLVVALLPARRTAPRPEGAVVGIGQVGEGVSGWRASHEGALEALEIARRRGMAQVHVGEAGLDRLFLGSLSAAELAEDALGGLRDLPETRRQMLTETLEAWLDAGGSPTEAARALQLHVQSFRYRLGRLREVLGAELDTADGRLRLHIAVKARRMQPTTEERG